MSVIRYFVLQSQKSMKTFLLTLITTQHEFIYLNTYTLFHIELAPH